mmetsp:Transcript_15376/g.13432  ORF Transcript_15376/g.13432 Transcript_15376/m.13432 type:complete len:103 (+) Transcript_15376:19-327(+)
MDNLTLKFSERSQNDDLQYMSMFWKMDDAPSLFSQGFGESIKEESQKPLENLNKTLEELSKPQPEKRRRRRRNALDPNGELSPKSRRKLQNKHYCKENRRKK